MHKKINQQVLIFCTMLGSVPKTSPPTIHARAEHPQTMAWAFAIGQVFPLLLEKRHTTSSSLCSHIYLSAGSLDAPTGCPQQSLEPARGSILYPGHTMPLHSYRTSGSLHLSGWTHSQPTSPNPEHGFLSTAGGLRRETKWGRGRSGWGADSEGTKQGWGYQLPSDL